MRILAIIPARGGSKGIPRKNLADLCGRPLIAWSIETGKKLVSSGTIDRCIVSTDDKEIAGIAGSYGADVPFMRPGEAATDSAKALAYVEHALAELEERNEVYDSVLLLQPTSPVRDISIFKEAILRFKNGSSDSMISCYQEDKINDLNMYDDLGDGTLEPRHKNHNIGSRRQEHQPVMIRNGSLYLTRVSYIRNTSRLICENPMFFRMSKIDSIDVDTLGDLELIQKVLSTTH